MLSSRAVKEGAVRGRGGRTQRYSSGNIYIPEMNAAFGLLNSMAVYTSRCDANVQISNNLGGITGAK